MLFLTAAMGLFCARCAEPSPPVPIDHHAMAINGGDTENGFPATVMLADFDRTGGGLCSGSLVAPRVVISAKHCFEGRGNGDPSKLEDWGVLIGPHGDRPEDIFGIVEILTTPEVEISNFDIEILILDRDVDIEPYEIRRELDDTRAGDGVTLCGYGENPSGGIGRKYSGSSAILGFGPIPESGIGENEIMTVGAAACGGDSGGTVLDADGHLIGVIVRGASEDCGSPNNQVTAITRVDAFLPLIDEGFEHSGLCVPRGDEVCDGRDNDCDGETDPGCVAAFGACTSDDVCVTGLCLESREGGKICTQACDAAVPVGACPAAGYCREVSCGEAYCMPGSAGARLDGEGCADDTDCSSLRCRERVCVTACTPGLGQCGSGQACAADGESCGSCVGAGRVDGPRGLGEPCAGNDDCAGEGLCAHVAGDDYCTTACDGECSSGYHCAQGACLRGDPGRDGEPCADDAECGDGTCQAWDGGKSCSSSCDESNSCPDDATCEDVSGGGSACEPGLGILGAACETGAECFGGLCARSDGARRCSESCDVADPCPTGFECIAAGAGARVCVLEVPDRGDSGGCRVAPGVDVRGLWLPALLMGVVFWRRRTRCDGSR